jgi:hypothetical protein
MSQTFAAVIPAAVDYQTTLILSIEVSNKSGVLAAQVPGLPHTKSEALDQSRNRGFADGHCAHGVGV